MIKSLCGSSLTFAAPDRPGLYDSIRPLMGGVLLMLLVLLLPLMTMAAPDAPTVASDLTAPSQVMRSLESALTGHRGESAYLKIRVGELENAKIAVQNEIDAYNSLGDHYSQLLLVPQLEREQLENALVNNRLVSRKLIERLKALEGHYASTLSLFKKNRGYDEVELKPRF
jgi:hypothetical protein